MKNLRKLTITTILTIILILIMAFCITGTAFCQNKGAGQAKEQYYRAMEREYVQEIRSLLEEKGYCNSGVTMNRVIDEDGARQYTVTIHHRRITKLSPGQQEELIEECGRIAFPVEDCNFCHEFLETDL